MIIQNVIFSGFTFHVLMLRLRQNENGIVPTAVGSFSFCQKGSRNALSKKTNAIFSKLLYSFKCAA